VLGESLVRCEHESTEASMPFRLRTFIGGRSRFENAGAIAMARAFAAIGTLERVSMPQNGIYHEGISALATAFVKCPNLKHLDLADNTLTERGATALAKVRARVSIYSYSVCSQTLPHLPALETLNLADCLVRSAGVRQLVPALKNSCDRLLELNLCGNELTPDNAREVLDMARVKPSLQTLHIASKHERGRAHTYRFTQTITSVINFLQLLSSSNVRIWAAPASAMKGMC
jgi:Ran GTPase-activating protein 1